MPDGDLRGSVRDALLALRRRFRVVALADAVAIGALAASLVLGLSFISHVDSQLVARAAIATWGLVSGGAAVVWWRWWTPARSAQTAERVSAAFENLLVTSEEVLAERRRAIHPMLRDEILSQALNRLSNIRASAMVRLLPALLRSTAIAAATVALIVFKVGSRLQPVNMIDSPPNQDRNDAPLIATIIPPSYTGRPTSRVDNPTELRVIEGSVVRLEIPRAEGDVQLIEPGQTAVTFARAESSARLETTINASRVWLIRYSSPHATADRLLQIHAESDRAPAVRIRVPARDLMFHEPRGTVRVEVEAADDLALAEVKLRYMTVSGSGEGLTFREGDIPLDMVASDARQWSAHADIFLERLGLEVGDAIVYRAIARDRRPGADLSGSESFLIEIGKGAEASTSGFTLPQERDRQGLSQQMLIMRTERLNAERARLPRDQVVEQSRMLATEQRMVRAEFIFMTGGEVEDEVAEAELGHELVEGRFENEGQRELLHAIREMSRAESRLTAGDTIQALTFERAALRALQRAFDRRRYLLRTLPERTRIDLARRLTGNLSMARSSSRRAEPALNDPTVVAVRTLLADLAAAKTKPGADAGLAARIAAIAPGSRDLATAASRIASDSAALRQDGIMAAQSQLLEFLRRRLVAASGDGLRRDDFAGHVADQIRAAGGSQ